MRKLCGIYRVLGAAIVLAHPALAALTASVPYNNMWVTWWNFPQLTLDGVAIAPANASWTTSNSNVAVFDSTAGRIVATGPGSARLVATVGNNSATIDITVSAPAIPVQIENIDSYLASPAAGALYEVPVVIIRYLPTTDGKLIDVAYDPDFYTLNQLPLATIKSNIDTYDRQVKFMVETGTRFRQYSRGPQPPSLGYRVVSYITLYEPTPPGKVITTPAGRRIFQVDYFQMMDRLNGRHYVEDLGVREFWVWTGGQDFSFPSYDPNVNTPETGRTIAESNMASPLTGDISNSSRDHSDMPVFARSYVVYGQNFRRSAAEAVHNRGHQLEAILSYINQKQDGNSNLFWHQFVGQNSQNQFIAGRCGWTHMPPNTTVDYDYSNMSLVSSDIADWKPDGSGEHRLVNASTWQNIAYSWPNGVPPVQSDPYWYLYWMQSMPGWGNLIPNGTQQMTNWWQFTAAWDLANTAGLGLYGDPGSYSLSATTASVAAPGGNISITISGNGPVWIAVPNAAWLHIVSASYGKGPGSVQVQADANTGAARQATIAVAGTPFAVTQAGPSSGVVTVSSLSPAVSAGGTQLLTVAFTASAGYQTLDVINVLINTALDGRHACYLAYSRPSNILYIVDDIGDPRLISGKAMDGSGTVANSQCSVALSDSSAAGSGTSFTLTLSLTFAPSFAGNKVVYAAARDLAQYNTGWQTVGVHAVLPMTSEYPAALGLTPAAANAQALTLRFSYADQTNAANLQTVWALINTAVDGREACYVAYYRPGNQLYLYPDNGDGTQAPSITLTGTNTIANGQCAVSAAGASVESIGNTLTLVLPISFHSNFSGFKGVWMAAQTLTGVTGTWQPLGAIVVP